MMTGPIFRGTQQLALQKAMSIKNMQNLLLLNFLHSHWNDIATPMLSRKVTG